MSPIQKYKVANQQVKEVINKPRKGTKPLNYSAFKDLKRSLSALLPLPNLGPAMTQASRAFYANKIVPDVIPFVGDVTQLKLKYPSGAEPQIGNELTPTQVKDPPSVSYKAFDDSYFTLIFTDPDHCESPEKVKRERLHWLVVNIPGNNVPAGDTLSGYIGSGPRKGTGIHRYVCILYRQNGKLSFDENDGVNYDSIDGRASFSSSKFAKKYNLDPASCNFFVAQYDSYVPLLYKSLKTYAQEKVPSKPVTKPVTKHRTPRPSLDGNRPKYYNKITTHWEDLLSEEDIEDSH